jgi:hypothetical protein
MNTPVSRILTPEERLNEAERAISSLSQLSRHWWTLRGTASAFLTDEEASTVDEATEALQNAYRRATRIAPLIPSPSPDTDQERNDR